MSGLDGMGSSGYSKYDGMSTEELTELLRLDAQVAEGETLDTEAILYITEVIANREKELPAEQFPMPDVDAAWDTFRTCYRPYLVDGRSLYDFDDEEDGQPPVPAPALSSKIHIARFRRIIAAAAAIAGVFAALTATAYAMGYDLWGAIAKWGTDTFTLVSKANPIEPKNAYITVPSNNIEYADLQSALDAYGITTLSAPTWMPDGFTVDEVTVLESSFNNSLRFQVLYVRDNSYFSICISMFHDSDSVYYSMWEKDDACVMEFEMEGISFYFMKNTEDPILVWWDGAFEGSISGNISSDEITKMAKSIYVRS